LRWFSGALIFIFRDRIAELASYGYLGLFVVSVVGNATVLLPMPSLVATFITVESSIPGW